MKANYSKSYLPYLNKLVDQYNNTYHHSIKKNPINTDYSASTGNIEPNAKAPKFKANDRVRTTKYKNIFSKGYTKNWSRKIFIINSFLKTNPWTYKIEYLNAEKTTYYIINEYIINGLLSRARQSYKIKIVLDLSNYATKKELDHATGVDRSDLATKKDCIALKAGVDKLDINKLVNFPTSLKNLKTKVDEVNVGKLKTVPVDLKKLDDVVYNEVAKNPKFNTLRTTVNSLEKKIPDATTLIHINQYNRDKQILVKKIGDVDKKY